MNLGNIITTILGVLLIITVTADAIQVTLGVRPRSRRRAPSQLFYNWALRVTQRLVGGSSAGRKERVLAWFGPLSILGLLVFWFVGHSLGFALIWTALPGAFEEPLRFDEAFYFSGVTYLTIGFGEIVPTSDWARFIAIAEGLLGVVMVALVMGFLATLYSIYLDRESQLKMLDVPGMDQIRAVDLVAYVHRGAGGDERLRAFFGEWARWAANITTWHTTYPIVGFFRSQHPGQSWITALGLLTDSAVIALLVHDGDHPEAEQMYRRGVQAITNTKIGPSEEHVGLTREAWSTVVASAGTHGMHLRDDQEAFDEVSELRRPYAGVLESVVDALAAPQIMSSSSTPAVPRHQRGD